MDLGNAECLASQPPAWWGWKLFTVTSQRATDGDTEASTEVSIRCGSAGGDWVPMTNKAGTDACETSFVPTDQDCHEA